MKVIAKSGPLLCDKEVLDHVTEVKEKTSTLQNAQTICVEIQAYLRERPSGNSERPQTQDGMAAFLKGLRENNIQLEKAELLQLVNSAPDNWPVLFTLIEEADIRLSEEQLTKILELSKEHLGFERIPQ